jgi:hypothetical protein
MALAASGTISFSDLRDEFSPGSNTSISFSDYYLNGSKVKPKAGDNNATHLGAGIPTSGALDLSDFYSKAIGYKFTISSDTTDQNASTIFGDDYDVDYPKIITVNSGVTVGATSTSAYAINVPSGASGSVTIENAGNVYGFGGSAGNAGGDAIFAGSECTITNTGNIKSGGGGGGNGGVGGKGVISANATLSEFVDEGGAPYGGGNAPANDAPSWFSAYGGSHNLNGAGAVGDRKWGGINNSHPQSGSVNTTWGWKTASSNFNGTLANRGPFYCSFKVSISGNYTVGGSINNGTYGSGYGSAVINISTSTGSAGTNLGNGNSIDLTANTTYYLVGYLSTSGSRDLYYNTFSVSFSLATNDITSGGAAGAGGAGASYNASAGSGGAGGSGGTSAGSGGAGGNGGALGVAGANGTVGGNGTGTGVSFPSSAPTNGTAGSSGGAAGNYINGLSNVTLNNSGTVAGNTA